MRCTLFSFVSLALAVAATRSSAAEEPPKAESPKAVCCSCACPLWEFEPGIFYGEYHAVGTNCANPQPVMMEAMPDSPSGFCTSNVCDTDGNGVGDDGQCDDLCGPAYHGLGNGSCPSEHAPVRPIPAKVENEEFGMRPLAAKQDLDFLPRATDFRPGVSTMPLHTTTIEFKTAKDPRESVYAIAFLLEIRPTERAISQLPEDARPTRRRVTPKLVGRAYEVNVPDGYQPEYSVPGRHEEIVPGSGWYRVTAGSVVYFVQTIHATVTKAPDQQEDGKSK